MSKYRTVTLLAALALLQGASGVFKMTKVECLSYNKTWAIFNKCRLRAVRRDVSEFNINITLTEPAYAIDLNILIMKRANGYKPFLVNFTMDACKFYEKRNHPVGNIILNLFQDFSNVNHTCPYMGDQILKGFYLRPQFLNKLPLPNGEYALFLTWILHKLKIFSTNVYFVFEE